MKGSKKRAPRRHQAFFDESCPTPEQLRIKGLANAISELMQIPSESGSADNALPLADLLFSGLKAMSGKALCINPNLAVRHEDNID